LGKDARLRGEKGPILGNAKFVGGQSQQQQPPASQSEPVGTPPQEGGSDDVPF